MLRRHDPALTRLEAARDRVASELTRYEILVGMRPDEERATEDVFAFLEWVPVTESVVRLAAALAREFQAAHGGVEDADYLIAATAIGLDAELVTINVRHFPMFGGLEPAY